MNKVDELMEMIESYKYSYGYNSMAQEGKRNEIRDALTQKECVWKYDWDDQWETNCGNRFETIDGSPTENKMEFCCYCGGKIVEETK